MGWLRWGLLGLVMVCVCETIGAQAQANTRRKIPSPMVSSSGKFSVGCTSEEREGYRWPVMKFVEKVVTNFETFFIPVGSTDAPLYLSLGTSTNEKDTHVTRRTLTITNTFSQLVIGVPNPDVVDLNTLRVAIVEALLRESCRTQTGRYTSFTWPTWFVRGMTYASFGNVWKAEAVEGLLKELEEGALPSLRALFKDTSLEVSDETAAFFATWVMESHAKSTRSALIVAPWTAEAILGAPLSEIKEMEWRQWVEAQGDKVFVPGAMTARHFERWQMLLEEPTTREHVLRITDALTRNAIGRPQLFRDLTVLYLEAYVAWLQQGMEGYRPKRERADEAAKILSEHLKRNPLLVDEALTPATGIEEWQAPNETK